MIKSIGTDLLVNALAGAAGGIVVGVIGIISSKYEIEKKKSLEDKEAKSEFLDDIDGMISKIEMSFQAFISDHECGDPIPYHQASNARHEVPCQEFIDYHTRNDEFASEELQHKCDEITQMCMKLKRFNLGTASDGPLGPEKSIDFRNLMKSLHDAAVEASDLVEEERSS